MNNIVLATFLRKNYTEPSLKNFLDNFNQEIVLEPNANEEEGGFFIEFKENGISFFLDKNYTLITIHLFSEGKDDFKEYLGKMPFDINFNMSKPDIIKILGKPNIKGGGKESIFGGIVPFWIRYDFKDYSIHCSFYPKKKSIELITLMSPEAVPSWIL